MRCSQLSLRRRWQGFEGACRRASKLKNDLRAPVTPARASSTDSAFSVDASLEMLTQQGGVGVFDGQHAGEFRCEEAFLCLKWGLGCYFYVRVSHLFPVPS